MRVVAVDWSGAKGPAAAQKIVVAEVVEGELVRFEGGRTRERVVEDEIVRAGDGEPVVIGLDFAFSMPQWFLREQGYLTAGDLWADTDTHERWLAECPPPFWGLPGRPRPDLGPRRHLRRADVAPAKSVFQIGGAGAVGTGSLRGFGSLARLRAAGFAIWPFDPAGDRTVVEIYPRLLTGPVRKGDPFARLAYVERHGLPTRLAISEDAFDAGVSALAMWEGRDALAALPDAVDDIARTEGEIWAGTRKVPGPSK